MVQKRLSFEVVVFFMEKRVIDGYAHASYKRPVRSNEELGQRSEDFYLEMDQRRTVREFDTKDVPLKVMENIILTAGTAPSGAHKQPWKFCLISDPLLKKKIRIAAEEEEKISYTSRMSATWKEDLKALGTNWEKPFLELAPHLIVVFKQSYSLENGEKHQHYYVNESVGIACGFLIAAIHNAGLVAVTHTPSPMNFLSELLKRPFYEKPYLIIPVGYAKEDTYVPDIHRKTLDEILVRY